MGRFVEIGVAVGLAIALRAEPASSEAPNVNTADIMANSASSSPHSEIQPKHEAFLPFTSQEPGHDPIEKEQTRYSGWLVQRDDLCQLWELQDAPTGGNRVVVFNSRPHHMEHQILYENIGEHIDVRVKPWQCEISPDTATLDAASVWPSPLDKKAYLPTISTVRRSFDIVPIIPHD